MPPHATAAVRCSIPSTAMPCHALPMLPMFPNRSTCTYIHVCVLGGGGVGGVVEANVRPVARLGACQGSSAGQGPSPGVRDDLSWQGLVRCLSSQPRDDYFYWDGEEGLQQEETWWWDPVILFPRHPKSFFSGLLQWSAAWPTAGGGALQLGHRAKSGLWRRGSSPGRVRWLDPAAGQGTTGWEAISSDAAMGTSDRGNPAMHTPGNWVASLTNSSGGSTSYVLLLGWSNRLLMVQMKDFRCFHARSQNPDPARKILPYRLIVASPSLPTSSLPVVPILGGSCKGPRTCVYRALRTSIGELRRRRARKVHCPESSTFE
ncbi:hypothetical protein BGZ61DRAFT_470396 [Ilyonectria robusta]|uniref:uncharacterized protein n=1 Tax=Ilyonectria robusta TaxID=1079257 RepID=UPI001E8CDFE7|nr:uncharacterized protein BGZ61DRAFT_470396 [Ilyonectria robusta]KAH8736889.1 hypothetical protein BGZ61DRAFT_470396 [Ilyonectria robusta]